MPDAELEKNLSLENAAGSNKEKMRILVMDDEEAIRNLTQRMLKLVGYDVDVTAHGEETLETYRRAAASGRAFDAVILDLTIHKGMGGAETASELLKIDADAAIVVSSGYTNDPATMKLKETGAVAVIPKPYQLQEMVAVLEKTISRRRLRQRPPA